MYIYICYGHDDIWVVVYVTREFTLLSVLYSSWVDFLLLLFSYHELGCVVIVEITSKLGLAILPYERRMNLKKERLVTILHVNIKLLF